MIHYIEWWDTKPGDYLKWRTVICGIVLGWIYFRSHAKFGSMYDNCQYFDHDTHDAVKSKYHSLHQNHCVKQWTNMYSPSTTYFPGPYGTVTYGTVPYLEILPDDTPEKYHTTERTTAGRDGRPPLPNTGRLIWAWWKIGYVITCSIKCGM